MITSKQFSDINEARDFYENNEHTTALTICKGVISVHFEVQDQTVEVVTQSGKFDSKGRSIDFILGTNVVDGQVYGWVQAARDGKEFGTVQRSKPYPSITAAQMANKKIAAERIAKLK